MFAAAKKFSQPICAMCALVAVLVGAPSRAGETQGQAPAVAVRYADLNLTTAEGVRVLYRRLKGASRQVCRAYEGRELAKAVKWRRCYDEALSAAVAKINLETLSALHKATGAQRVS